MVATVVRRGHPHGPGGCLHSSLSPNRNAIGLGGGGQRDVIERDAQSDRRRGRPSGARASLGARFPKGDSHRAGIPQQFSDF